MSQLQKLWCNKERKEKHYAIYLQRLRIYVHSPDMRIGSLFSGIGGLDLGLVQSGHEHDFLCESDSYRREVLRARFPGIPIFGDVCLVGKPTWGAVTDDTGAPVNLWGWQTGSGLLCGGFPCQDLSVAGKRAGLRGTKSGLFFEFARISTFLRPRHVLLENVPGIFSSGNGEDFGIVLETLARIGYGVAWRTLDSRFFGVPQRRRRVYILGTLADGDPVGAARRSAEVLAVGQSCGWHPQKGNKKRSNASTSSLSGLGSGGPDDNDGQANRIVSTTIQGRRGHDEQATYVTGFHLKQDPINGPQSPALGTTSGGMGVLKEGVRKLTPVECERLQGLPDEWTNLGSTPDSRRYAAIGDAVSVPVARWIGERLAT